jgi:hypothetical protein
MGQKKAIDLENETGCQLPRVCSMLLVELHDQPFCCSFNQDIGERTQVSLSTLHVRFHRDQRKISLCIARNSRYSKAELTINGDIVGAKMYTLH